MNYNQFTKKELVSMLECRDRGNLLEPKDTFERLKSLYDPDVEHFYVIPVNGRFKPICITEINKGTANHCLVHPRDVYREAISKNAVGVMVAHNHPAGGVEPSEYDLKLYDSLKKAGELLKLPLVDAIQFTQDTYCSCKEKGLI